MLIEVKVAEALNAFEGRRSISEMLEGLLIFG
jgi:hypothetical protein